MTTNQDQPADALAAFFVGTIVVLLMGCIVLAFGVTAAVDWGWLFYGP